MDIRGVAKIINPLATQKVDKIEKGIKSENTTEREGNGQMASGDDSEHRPPMNDEEFQKALEHLKNLSVFKEHHLDIVVKEADGKRIIIIQEPSGKIIRRILETELWTLQEVKDKEKGQLLSKSA